MLIYNINIYEVDINIQFGLYVFYVQSNNIIFYYLSHVMLSVKKTDCEENWN